MMTLDKNENNLSNLSNKILTPGRSLLLPMVLLALGLHAALLVLPLPSSEAQKEPDDKKNPITVTQIPTEKPPKPTPTAKVDVPPLKAAATPAEPSTAASDTASGSSDSGSSSGKSASSSSSDSGSDSSASSATNPSSSSDNASVNSPASSGAESGTPTETTSIPEPPAANSENATVVAVNPFANFPHYQPSEADCFGLGFGDNCRTVQNVAIAQVSEFFQKELTAKEFTTTLVTDEPTRKVFKVGKGDKTLFLNIWQGKDQVAYLLSRVILKQSPEQIKTEAEVR